MEYDGEKPKIVDGHYRVRRSESPFERSEIICIPVVDSKRVVLASPTIPRSELQKRENLRSEYKPQQPPSVKTI